MGNSYKQTRGYVSLGWLSKVAVIIALIISLSSLGCGGSASKTEEKASKRVQSESTKENASGKAKPKASSQESNYAEAVSQQVSKWGSTVDNLGSLIEDPHIDDKNWNAQVKAQVEQMKSLIGEASRLSSPDKYKEVHDNYMKAVSEFGWVADNLAKAIDDLDANALSQCSQKMDNGSNYINEVKKAMDKLSEGEQ